MRRVPACCCSALLAACAGELVVQSSNDMRIVPDNPAKPTWIRFEVPTAMLMGLPGDRVPVTLEARIATHEIATHGLAATGYCPRGFDGPEGITFPDGDRSRSVFSVRCLE